MTQLSCPMARSMVSDYIDGDLPRDQARSLEDHLQTCQFCPPLYASLVETLTELKALDDVGGVDQLVRRVLAALAEPPGPDDPLPRRA
ncbi:MAG TPA: zf-HC2 domain-containing protein [Acidimicrobiales bacterium]|jgi:anti-sigma factor RsiW|nr:zf-HC2 domain-containing protein [Acidimicrobiales bacterium]